MGFFDAMPLVGATPPSDAIRRAWACKYAVEERDVYGLCVGLTDLCEWTVMRAVVDHGSFSSFLEKTSHTPVPQDGSTLGIHVQLWWRAVDWTIMQIVTEVVMWVQMSWHPEEANKWILRAACDTFDGGTGLGFPMKDFLLKKWAGSDMTVDEVYDVLEAMLYRHRMLDV